jgi:antitoxin component of RelBE/YafQ-DinJ toxin-antitoxin module
VYPLEQQCVAKNAAIRIRVEPELHRKFLDACKAQNVPASQIIREFMRQYVIKKAPIQTSLFDLLDPKINK